MMQKKKIFIYLVFSFAGYCMLSQNSGQEIDSLNLYSEKTSRPVSRISISGYIQTQFQYGEEFASLKIGTSNEKTGEEVFDRIGIRRGRIKLTYSEKFISTVFQLDITEKGVGLKDAYFQVKDPWKGVVGLKAGVLTGPLVMKSDIRPPGASLRRGPCCSMLCFRMNGT